MIRWPNIGLFGQFEPCEAGILAALNQNMFLLDTLVQMSILDFVTELPEDPDSGDRYILESDSYAYSGGPNSIMVYDGEDWISIEPRPGYIAYVESENGFFWYNGTDWVVLPTTIGDVSGPGSSLNNSIARFDGVTGKFITDSGVVLDDSNSISGVTSIYSDTGVFDVLKVKSLDVQLNYDTTSTGSGAALPYPPTLVTKLLNDSLLTIDSIVAPPSGLFGRIQVYINETESDIFFNNTSSIITGTGSDLKVVSGASIFALYDPSTDQWRIIGGSGGGGQGIITVADLTARDAIAPGDRYEGLIVYVLDDSGQPNNYQLQGGITDSDWVSLDFLTFVTATQTLDNADVISLLPGRRSQRVKVKSSGGEVTCTLPNGTIDGESLYVQGMDNDNPVLLDPSANLHNNGTDYFVYGTLKLYIWDEELTQWIKRGDS